MNASVKEVTQLLALPGGWLLAGTKFGGDLNDDLVECDGDDLFSLGGVAAASFLAIAEEVFDVDIGDVVDATESISVE